MSNCRNLLVAAALLGIAASATATETPHPLTLTIGSAVVHPGQYGTVPLSVTAPASGEVGAIDVGLYFSDSRYLRVTDPLACVTAAPGLYVVTDNTFNTPTVLLPYGSPSLMVSVGKLTAAAKVGPGRYATLRVFVDPTAPYGSLLTIDSYPYNRRFPYKDPALNVAEERPGATATSWDLMTAAEAVTVRGGTVAVGALGDVDADRVMDLADVLRIVRIALGAEAVGYQALAADVNQDGAVDMLDAAAALRAVGGVG